MASCGLLNVPQDVVVLYKFVQIVLLFCNCTLQESSFYGGIFLLYF